jgi:hypothetical protein
VRQLLLALLAGLSFIVPVEAQVFGFNQLGRVSQELLADGLCIAHSSLPLNSKVKLVNLSTGKEIEAAVIRHIPASLSRIADVSFGAWQELGLAQDSLVRIYTDASLRSRSVPLSAGGDAFPAPGAVSNGGGVREGVSPVNSVEPAYGPPGSLALAEQALSPEFMAWLTAVIPQSKEVREAREKRKTSAAPREALIIPGLPDGNSGKVYRLQIGAFSTESDAARFVSELANSGFNIALEPDGTVYRVFAADIPAAMVYYAALKLGGLGVTQILLRE